MSPTAAPSGSISRLRAGPAPFVVVAVVVVGASGCGDVLHGTNWQSLCDRTPSADGCPGASGAGGGSGGGSSDGGSAGAGSGGSAGAAALGGAGGTGGSGGAAGGATSGSCDAIWGDMPGYVLCEETDEKCVFVADQAGGSTCTIVCAVGGTCLAAYAAGDGGCMRFGMRPLSCDTLAEEAVCECQKGANGPGP